MRHAGEIGGASFGWVLLLVACADPATPPEGAATATTGPVATAFVDVTREVGLDFAFDRAAAGDYFMPDSMAAGAALLDVDGDGRLDVYIVNGLWADGSGRHAEGANRLYRQQPNGRFVDVTEPSGAGDQGYGMGVAVGDVDNDGDPDLYVTNYGPDALYLNDGDGNFADATREAGLGDSRWGASAGFVDYDADEYLDLFVTTYLDLDPALRTSDSAGRPEYPGPRCCDGTPDILYRNNGDGTFTDVSDPAGIGALRGKGLGVVFADLNGDGRVDIYVANDGESNHAWIQGEEGTFTDRGQQLGLSLNVHGGAEAGMGIAIGDLHGSGRLDLLVTHLSQETNTLYRDTGSYFADATLGSGLGATSVDYTGFGITLLDFDLDGDLDPLVVNGRVLRGPPRPGVALNAHWAPYAEENLLHENDGTGRFRVATESCGALCSDIEVSRGLAAGDIDNDGDLDVLATSGNGSVRLYRNVRRHQAHWLAVRAVEPLNGRDTLGARVHVRADGRELRRDIAPGYGYLSSGDPRAYFGLGPATHVDAVRIVWPDGTEEQFGDLEVDRIHRLVRGDGD